ncbi:hypothetical protein BS78_07G000700 [Paspalum vaginatum]|nr:hypothetical protein BS78_07G000700 [Paspalum vaginatum]
MWTYGGSYKFTSCFYGHSSGVQKSGSSIRWENKAFESLIRQRSLLMIPVDQENPLSQEQNTEAGKSTPPSTETIKSASVQASSSQAKRKLDVNQVDPIDAQGKQQKKHSLCR